MDPPSLFARLLIGTTAPERPIIGNSQNPLSPTFRPMQPGFSILFVGSYIYDFLVEGIEEARFFWVGLRQTLNLKPWSLNLHP